MARQGPEKAGGACWGAGRAGRAAGRGHGRAWPAAATTCKDTAREEAPVRHGPAAEWTGIKADRPVQLTVGHGRAATMGCPSCSCCSQAKPARPIVHLKLDTASSERQQRQRLACVAT